MTNQDTGDLPPLPETDHIISTFNGKGIMGMEQVDGYTADQMRAYARAAIAQAAQTANTAGGSPCQYAIDAGGNLYRRYASPVCAGCVPAEKVTDKWESARIADYNAGWNACRTAALAAAAKDQP